MNTTFKMYSFLCLIFFALMTFSGCASVPFFNDSEEEEVELESDFEEFEAIEMEAPLEIEELKEEIRILQSRQEDAQLKNEELENMIVSLAPRIKTIEDSQKDISENRGSMDNITSVELENVKDSILKLGSEIDQLKDNIAKMEYDSKLSSKPGRKSKGAARKNYDKALQSYNIKQYKESLGRFENLDNERTPLSLRDNVIFWMGQSYFKLGEFKKAVEKFKTVINEHKGGNKVFDSMYMLGVSYNSLGEKSMALDYLEQALNDGPPSEIRTKIERKIKEIEG